MIESSAKELELIEEMQSILKDNLSDSYKKGQMKRDAHPKTIGLVKANFKVLDTTPEELKAGVFHEAKTFKAWVRYSNSSTIIKHDEQKDFRGMAIKLLGVEGDRFSTLEDNTQDFLVVTNPVMPTGTVKVFRHAIHDTIKINALWFILRMLFTFKLKVLIGLGKKKQHTNLLNENFWSTTPYMLGEKIVKYKLVPTSSHKASMPSDLKENYLTDTMQEHLDTEPATFDFCVQLFQNEKTTPTEDAGEEWLESESPLIKIAEVEIPQQKIDTLTRWDLAERASFSPANALKAHTPIGGLNRARIKVYGFLSKFRHQQNDETLFEPKLADYDAIS